MAEHRDTRLRFEQWARNPLCSANTISAVHGVAMAEVVKREGGTPTMGQSPFALARGQTFERALFRDEAAVLREALITAQVLPKSTGGFRDFRLRQSGGPFGTLNEARTATASFLRDVAAAGPARALPSVIAGAVVRIPAV
jgi:hypothetical protein